ncbi:hypothetical protein OUZ56_031678 [Daphnia magna]|uniref:Uncharacterized protein n=1 Tax=Daphnia magna TaxID=35525 RepID=A0ABQ9ZUW3_9CRUS|nr:hypothetical protein OUZ56_031678 [Daphnia magna]
MSKNKSHAIVVERFKGLHNYATCVTRRVQKSPGVGAVVKGARKRSTVPPRTSSGLGGSLVNLSHRVERWVCHWNLLNHLHSGRSMAVVNPLT